jgi:uncharacterized protein (DUF1800 family)
MLQGFRVMHVSSLPAGAHWVGAATVGLRRWTLLLAAASLLVAGCGGGSAGTAPVATPAPAVLKPADRAEALRFLTMSTFGPTEADATQLQAVGYSAWIDAQLALPASSHRSNWQAADAALKAADATASAGTAQVLESFWKQALTGPDQLRQRVAFALSQIMVLSSADGEVSNQPRALAAWLDMLNTDGLTTYRQLLESVARHPLMGRYLTHLRNQKADPATGRVPDENFAREVMQLFSIGLVRLNADGSPQLVGGQPVETYGPADISGIAKVFTGWSFACPAHPNNSCFFSGSSAGVSDPDREFKAMLGYPQFHSTEAKSFLGVTVPAQTTADPSASLKLALDTLAAHPNVGPFIGRQLIQRLVSSNPSPAYVAAVSAVWADNGAGVRGDMKAVIKAILLHPEARSTSGTGSNASGKLREPVLRLSAYLRAFPHTSDTGAWKVGDTDNPGTALGQTPLRAPSVFNFYRPGYKAPNSRSAAAGLVAPELQLLNETSVAGWISFMRDNLSSGVGQFNGVVAGTTLNRRDLQRAWTDELALADTPDALAGAVIGKLLAGQAATALRVDIVDAVNSIAVPALAANGSNQAAVTAARRNRVNAAVLLALASPEFLVQK